MLGLAQIRKIPESGHFLNLMRFLSSQLIRIFIFEQEAKKHWFDM